MCLKLGEYKAKKKSNLLYEVLNSPVGHLRGRTRRSLEYIKNAQQQSKVKVNDL